MLSTGVTRKRKTPVAEELPAHLKETEQIDTSLYKIFLKTSRSHVIKNWIEGLRYIISEGTICFSPEDGGIISLSSVNTSETVFVFTKLLGHLFENWFCEEKTTVSVNFAQLFKAMKGCTEKDLFSMYVLKDQPEKLYTKTEATQDLTTTHTIQLLELPESNIRIRKKLSYSCQITISSSQFSKVLRDMEHVGSTYCQMTVVGDTLTLTSVSNVCDDTGHVKQESTFKGKNIADTSNLDDVYQSEAPTAANEAPKIYTGTFLLKYLTFFVRHVTLSEVVRIYLRNDFPLLIEYKVSNLGYLRFIVVPSNATGNAA